MNPSSLDVIGYGLLTSIASQKLELVTYGGVFYTMDGRGIDLDVGESRPGRGHQWCNPIKGICCGTARLNLQHGEPLLASLVRHADGTIGKGYATAVLIRYDKVLTTDAQIQAHADAERAQCWAYFEVTA